MSIKRLVSKLTKENLWIYIITELSKHPMYAYEITKKLKNGYHIPVSTVAVYVTLHKMRKEGIIMKVGNASSLKKPARKYYAITEKGASSMDEAKKLLNQIVELLSGASTET